ncbi:AKAP7 2'5' RNA ligase-like domain-containing protein [Pilobolus umbonatus]|nr:AKAP7 2'5' RNA ligase-like domain-containing protein [Pilobolus umbonatus]
MSASTSTEELSDIVTEIYPLSSNYHGILLGKGGSNLKRLKIETGTRIDIQKGVDQITIKGHPDKIEGAKLAIDRAIQEGYEKARPTHFLSLTISSNSITRKLDEMHHTLLSNAFKCEGLDSSILVIPANFHITLGVMKLFNQNEIERAVRILKEECPPIIQSILDNNKLMVKLSKLSTMQPSPAKAHVLYIDPEDVSENKVLKELCTSLINKMIEAGVMVAEDRPLKLHATLINTSNRVSDKKNSREPFDARPILKEFKNIDFGTVILDKLHIMKMGRTGPGKTYQSEGSISLV